MSISPPVLYSFIDNCTTIPQDVNRQLKRAPGAKARPRIFDVTWKVVDRSAQLVREYRSRGRTLGIADALIAGTCLLHSLTLVTYNRKHYPIAELEIYPVLPLD